MSINISHDLRNLTDLYVDVNDNFFLYYKLIINKLQAHYIVVKMLAIGLDLVYK